MICLVHALSWRSDDAVVDVDLDLREPSSHLVRVELRLQPRLPQLRLQLPAWTPGSYLIRDYVRNLEGLEVVQGSRVLTAQRLGPACWQVEVDPAASPLTIRYRILATDLTVRTCHLDHEHGFLALAAVVLEVEGERWSPHRLRCLLPEGWRAFSSLPGSLDVAEGVIARDLDQLLDAPLECGPHAERAFSVAGVPHRWVTWAGASSGDGSDDWLLQTFPTLLSDVEQVCLACCRLMGVPRPASEGYLFILHLVDDGYGGLEHDDGTVLIYGRRNLAKADGYRKFLQLVAHEYLHQWNVRRLRPAELTPIDYHRPVAVPTLWFAEGITSYVDQFLPLTAGLSTAEQLLEDLGAELSRYRLTPGRFVQSLRQSSQEAWVKLYRADAYSGDSQISYYLKGAVVALCLDLHLRRSGSCLAVVLQTLWQRFGRYGRGYQEADVLTAFSDAAADLGTLLPNWLESVDDPDLDGYLRDVGLLLEPVEAETPWIGLTAAVDAGQLIARRVQRGGPAETAGLMVGDELLALDGLRLRDPEQLSAALRPGAEQQLLMARRSQIRSLTLSSLPPRPDSYKLIEDPEADAQALQRREQWLSLLGGASW